MTPLVVPVRDFVSDFKKLDNERKDPEILQLLQAEARRPIDVKNGPLWRPLLLRVGKDEHILAFITHHTVFDGASEAIFLRELSAYYRASRRGQEPEFEALPVQYADYACWQRLRAEGERAERQLVYWEKKLAGAVPELRLPIDRAKSTDRDPKGGSRAFELPDRLAMAVNSLGRDEQASPFVTLLSAFAVLLHRYTGQEDLIVCSPFAARERAELEHLIGYFNNIVVLRCDLTGTPRFRDALRGIRQLALDASEHQTLPLQRIAEFPNLTRTTLTSGMFCYQDLSIRDLDLPDIQVTPIDLRKQAADFKLAMYMQSRREGELSGFLEYDADLFDSETIDRLIHDFEELLEIVTADPDLQISSLPAFGPARAEVASRIEAHPRIDRAVVVDLPDHSGSAAYLVLNEFNAPALDEIRAFAAETLPDYLVPLAFVPLDLIPLDEAGNADRSALPVPVITSGWRRATEYVAPRTELETELAAIWKDVLWLDQDVGIHDHFNDLGGHSLLSVHLVAALEKHLGRRLPVSVLARLSTIAEMAADLERAGDNSSITSTHSAQSSGGLPIPDETYRALLSYTASWEGFRVRPESLVIGLNTEGTRDPLFLCMQRYGELTQLAKYFGPEQPVYGMRSGNRVMVKNHENISALARQYVTEILEVEPRGPFYLAGVCQAALISFQIAKQLQALGHEVRILIMLEKFVAEDYSGRVAMLFGKESNRQPHLYYQNPEFGWQKYYSGHYTFDWTAGGHGQLFQEPNIQVLAETVARMLAEAETDEDAEPADPVPLRDTSAYQRLGPNAYRARLIARGSWTLDPEETILIPVEVQNTGGQVWEATERSGIQLANQWVRTKGKFVNLVDGRTPLPHDLAPGESVDLELVVKAPRKHGRWMLSLDLVEEGISWFGAQGSPLVEFEVEIRKRVRLRTRLKRFVQRVRAQ